jgi:hypothetical protein
MSRRNTNAIKQRLPKSAENLKQLESKFIDNVEKLSLNTLSLDELAYRFDDIEQQSQLIQGQILLEARNRFANKKEFGAWVQKTGGSIAACGKQHRTTLMNLARFFSSKDLTGIAITAAYQISAPINADVAQDVYEFAKGKNLPIAEVKRQIALKKGDINASIIPTSVDTTLIKAIEPEPTLPPPVIATEPPRKNTDNYIIGSLIPNSTPYITGSKIAGLPEVEDELEFEEEDKPVTTIDLKSQLMAIAKTASPQIAIVALQDCIRELNALRYPLR